MEEGIKILVIDDDAVDRQTLRRALKKADLEFSLTEFYEAPEVLNHLAGNNNYDCIFLDYLLPGTDGLALLKKLRLGGTKTPIIIITSQGDEKLAVEMMKSGASDYVVKDQITAPNIKKIIQSVTLLRNVERQKEATEQALKLSEARLSVAQKIAKIGNWERNLKNNEIYWSEEMYRIFEVDPDKYDPKDHLNLFHPDDKHLIKQGFENAKSGKPHNLDMRIILPEGNYKCINVQGYLQYDEQNQLEKLYGTVQDINQRKLVERELRDAKKVAEESGKIKEQFLANMSHEIRTPMNAITGFTKLLLQSQANFTSEQQRYINFIHNAGENLLVIINDILDFSKIEAGKLVLEHVDFYLQDVVDNVLGLFKGMASKKNVIIFEVIDEEVPLHLKGDPVRLNQVLMNLISNAIKFTEKGHIKLEVSSLRQSGTKVLLRFTVEDTGIGISEDTLKRVFDSFTQASSDTTRKFGGTGLGLTIAKKIVALQKGEINVRSKLGKGTVFITDLPFKKGAADVPKASMEGISKQKATIPDYPRHLKVLMAEDNVMNQELSIAIFKDIGWALDIANNGLVALEKLQASKYDIVLMDIQMPIMDGYEATLQIRNKLQAPLSEIPIMAITAHALNSEINKCLAAGMNDYISKPFKTSDLISKVCALVSGKGGARHVEEAPDMVVNEVAPVSINLDNLLMLSGSNPATLSSIIDIFMKETPAQTESLQQFLLKKDWNGLKSLCHKMKSSYAIIGATDVKKHLEEIEMDCMNKKIDAGKFNEHIQKIMELNTKIIQELEVKMPR